ncbi:MAG: type II and III secretion system protein family protein [Pseudomonadota bacterium]
MKRLNAKLLLVSLAAAPLAAVPATTATAQQIVSPSQDIVLSIGRGELITVPGSMSDVFVANEGIADVQVKSQRQLYVFGRAGGETTIYASNAAGTVIWSANVRVGSNIDSIDQMLALAMPAAKIGIATMGTNTVLLTGTVAAPEDAAEAERLVQAFIGPETNVITRLKTATPLQVNLQVKFAEVSRTLVREIGGNLTTFDASTGGFRGAVGTGRNFTNGEINFGGPLASGNGVAQPTLINRVPVLTANGTQAVDPTTGALLFEEITIPGTAVNSNGGTTLSGLGSLFGIDVVGALDLSERLGLVTTLSQPNLTALSGETATFLAGGEFPIPISQGLGNVAIEYRDFGVSLAYTPTVLANGRISLRVRPEISELSTQGAVTLNGFQVPALTIRRTETTIELGSGQSFMIAGLLSNNSQNALDKAPGLGDVPILGNLFRSRSYNRGETELVIVVTPFLVKPVNASEIKLPTDGFHSANEFEQLLTYQDNSGKSGEQRPGPTAAGGEEAPSPDVGNADPAAIVPNNAPTERRTDKKRRKKDRQADAAAPGFSL